MDSIVFENISKSYEERLALNEIGLSIPTDVTTAVIGPSGSGKSTLIQLINGLIRPDRGTVFVFGQEIDYEHLPELRQRIGYAVQGTGLFPHLTVESNITLLAQLQKWEDQRIRERLYELMNLVDLPPEYSSKYPHELSGGEQQRVGLCRAMMLNPKIFLLDEPFGALDPITRNDIHKEFLKLQNLEARTIVLVTHDLTEALRLANHIAIFNKGKLEQFGTRDEILENPGTSFVEDFVHTQLESQAILPTPGTLRR